jgi:hypothetical protein
MQNCLHWQVGHRVQKATLEKKHKIFATPEDKRIRDKDKRIRRARMRSR